MSWETAGRFVKVCGLGTAHDVEAAAEVGADAVGFVWWPPSPRHLDLDAIRPLAQAAPMTTVLVTVDLDSQGLLAAAAQAGVDAVQPHGENAAVAAMAAGRLGLGVIRPVAAGEEISAVGDDDLLLVDNPDPDLPGGTGRAFDWEKVASIEQRYLLAGGLTPDTVAGAVAAVNPFGVDASSGLESAPGVKDPHLIRRFVQEAKKA